jgi:hypothetical protein
MFNLLAAEETIHKFKQHQLELEARNVAAPTIASPSPFHKVLRQQFSEAPTVDRTAMRSAHLSWYATDPSGDEVRLLEQPHYRRPEGGGGWTSASQATPLGFYRPAYLSGGGEVGSAQKPAGGSHYLFDEACERRRVHDGDQQKSDMGIARSAAMGMPWLRRATLDYGAAAAPLVAPYSPDGPLQSKYEDQDDAEAQSLARDAFHSAQLYDDNPRRSMPCQNATSGASDGIMQDPETSHVLGVYQYRNVEIRDEGPRRGKDVVAYKPDHELFYHLSSGAAATNSFLADNTDNVQPPQRTSWLSQQSSSAWRESPGLPASKRPTTNANGGAAALFDFPFSAQRSPHRFDTFTSKVLEDLEPQLYPSALQAVRDSSTGEADRSSPPSGAKLPSAATTHASADHRTPSERAVCGQRFSPFMTRGSSGKIFAR